MLFRSVFQSICLLPLNYIQRLEYSKLIPGTYCEVLEVHNCEIMLGKQSYYDCNLDINCYNTTMTAQMQLPKLPQVNGTIYNEYQDSKIRQYNTEFIIYNVLLVLIPIPFIFLRLIVYLACGIDIIKDDTMTLQLQNCKHKESEIIDKPS